MPGPNAPYTQLDSTQVLKQVYDETTDRLRVDTEATIVAGAMEVAINHVDDSIKIGDGTTLVDVTPANELQTSDSDSHDKLDTLHSDLLVVEGKQDAGNSSLSSIDTKLSSQATAANQVTGNASLSSIDSKITSSNTKLDTLITQTDAVEASLAAIDAGIPVALGQTTMANSMPVVLPSNQIVDVSLYDSSDNGLTSTNAGVSRALDTVRVSASFNRFCAPINVRQAAATASGEVVWSMRNSTSATKNVYIDEIEIQMHFDSGSPLGRSTNRYNIQRFDTATPTGGSAITPFEFDTASDATNVTDVRTLTTGLTTTGIVLGNILAIPAIPTSDGSASTMSLTNLGIKLAAGEGLLISLAATADVGQYIGGVIIWSER